LATLKLGRKIQEMEHHVCAGFGISEGRYGNSSDKPPAQGVLQGNGTGPAAWFAISSVLIKILCEAGFGHKEWTVIRNRAINIACLAFFDDTDIIHSNQDPFVTSEDLVDEAQRALLLWNGLLRATGGALAPAKGYWYLVEMVRKHGHWQYASPEDTPGVISLPGSLNPIDRRPVHQTSEALGVQVHPDGIEENQVEYLLSRTQQWSESLRTRRIKPSEAWYCLQSSIMKTIEYPLMSTTLTRKQLQMVMQPILQDALRKCGIQRNLPRKLLYGTLRGRGLGLQDPFWTQLIHHLQAILRHCHRGTPTSMLLNEGMELVQLYVGSDQTFWELPYAQYGFLVPEGWIKHTWASHEDTTLTLRGPNLAISIKRQNDVHLMDAFIDHGYSQKVLLALNECRLHLQATTLADICTTDGTLVDLECWHG
jgi:hypothetical protein